MYDARISEDDAGGMGQLAYTALVLVLVTVAFLTVLLWPTKGEANAAETNEYRLETATANNEIFSSALPDLKPARLQNALRALDQISYKKTETALFRSRDQAEAMTLLANEIGAAVERNRDAIAQAPVVHFDQILSSVKDELRRASRQKAKWCAGDRFANFSETPPRPDLGGPLIVQFINSTPELSQYLLDLSAMVLEAGVDGASNGVDHGSLTTHDRAILEGVVVSMLSDPQILKMMMAVRPEATNEDVLAKLDACAVGVSALSALITMPQSTKGRVWAEIISGNGDISELALAP